MTDILIDDVIYTILLNVSLGDVAKFSRIDKRFAEVCRSERGIKEIKRKEREYYEILIDDVIKRSQNRLFEIIRHNYIPYLSNDKYIRFVREIYPKTEKNADILDSFCKHHYTWDIMYRFPHITPLVIEKENDNVLKAFLYANKDVVKRLKEEIGDILIKHRSDDPMAID